MATSNTTEVFREAIGRRIVGLYRETWEHPGIVVVLVLDDGTGLAFGTGNGSHWTVSRKEVERRAHERKRELLQLERELRDVMELEGVMLSVRVDGGSE